MDNVIRKNITIFTILALPIWSYIILRSYQLGFTHDEALSWKIYQGDYTHLKTANTHWMNTLLSWLPGLITGFEAWALRLPNVISFGVMIFYLNRILKEDNLKWLGVIPILGFILLNHYVLELFGLFRGYGLALSGCVVSYWYAKQYGITFSSKDFLKFQIACLFTLYSNYGFLYPVLALQGWILRILFMNSSSPLTLKGLLKSYGWLIPAYLPAFLNLWELIKRQELYFGGNNGFIHDTLGSILHYSFQFELHPFQDQVFTTGFILIWIILTLYAIRYQSRSLANCVLQVCILLPVVFNLVLQIKYPMERSAIYLTLFLGLSIAEWISDCRANARFLWLFSGMLPVVFLTLATVYGTWYRFNFRYASTWYYDEHNRKVLELLLKQSLAGPLSVGISWVFEPSMNYYREQGKLSRLQPFTREPLEESQHTFYYVFDAEIPDIRVPYETIEVLPDTRTRLLRSQKGFP